MKRQYTLSIHVGTSDFRLCKRGLYDNAKQDDLDGSDHFKNVEITDSDQTGDDVTDHGDYDDVESDTYACENENSVEYDGEFAADVEQMKAMGLPLSFVQCKSKNVSL